MQRQQFEPEEDLVSTQVSLPQSQLATPIASPRQAQVSQSEKTNTGPQQAPPSLANIQPLRAAAAPPRQSVLDRLRRNAHNQRIAARLLMGLYYTGVGAFIFCTCASLFHWINLAPELRLAFVICYVLAIIGARAVGSRWRNAVAELTNQVEIEEIGALVEGLEIHQQSDFARDALDALLPRMRSENGNLLSSEQRDVLNRFLGRNAAVPKREDISLALSILKAYEQVGDARALNAVARLAEGHGYAARDERVRQAAQRCLPICNSGPSRKGTTRRYCGRPEAA